jgi:hypothetical protein
MLVLFWIFFPRQPTYVLSRPGNVHHQPLVWRTGVWRSLAQLTERWLSMHSTVVQRLLWLILKVRIHVLLAYDFLYFDTSLDSNAPTFANMVNGQVNLHDAVRRQIDFEIGGKKYKLVDKPAVLIVR